MRLLIIPRNNQFHSNLKYKKSQAHRLPFSQTNTKKFFFFFQGPMLLINARNHQFLNHFLLLAPIYKRKICVSRVDFSSRVCHVSFFPLSPHDYLLVTMIYLFQILVFFSQYHFDLYVFKWLKLLCPMSKSHVFIDNCYISHLSLKLWVFMLI